MPPMIDEYLSIHCCKSQNSDDGLLSDAYANMNKEKVCLCFLFFSQVPINKFVLL